MPASRGHAGPYLGKFAWGGGGENIYDSKYYFLKQKITMLKQLILKW